MFNREEEEVKEFKGKVHMLVLYGKEAHPGSQKYSNIKQPTKNKERMKLASMSSDEMKISVPVLADDVNNRVVDAYGGLANCGYIIGQDGRVFHKLSWIHPSLMRGPLEALLKMGGSGGANPQAFPVGGNHPRESGTAREIDHSNPGNNGIERICFKMSKIFTIQNLSMNVIQTRELGRYGRIFKYVR